VALDGERPGAVTLPGVNRGAQVSLLRWLRRQLQAARRRPASTSEAAVENDDPSEVRRLLADMPFSDAQRRHVEGTCWDAWEEGPLGLGARDRASSLLDAVRRPFLACRVDRSENLRLPEIWIGAVLQGKLARARSAPIRPSPLRRHPR